MCTGENAMKRYIKFAALVVIVVGTVLWLAFAGASESKTYYKTISEVGKMGNEAYSRRMRIGGDVDSGSIRRIGNRVQFVLSQDKDKMTVVYTGTDPLPDTFKDGAQALADGKLDTDGVFRATRIQAKCASKYESKPGSLPPRAPANIRERTL